MKNILTGAVENTPSAQTIRHRHLFVLSGSIEWCHATAANLLTGKGYQQTLWITTKPPPESTALPAEKVHTWLGRELDALVFDAWAGFDPDAFGATIGTVRGGGVVLLLAPPLAEWPDYADPALQRFATWPCKSTEISSPFLQRLVRLISTTTLLQLIQQGDPHPELPPPSDGSKIHGSADQQQAVDAICHVVHGHRRRPLVLTADRGRGKSSALGIAAAQLLQQGLTRILVTAPCLDAVAALFQHAGRLLPRAETTRGELQHNGASIQFIPPDKLLQRPQPADLLLVDEAAAIPAPLLEALLKQHSRIVFSTTIHGYEGSGRGFTIRFRNTLNRITPGWSALHLSQPIRWTENDPVEQFTFHALLLNAAPASDEVIKKAEPHNCELVKLERDQLLNDETLLTELFGLLTLAHYRTRPGDLRNLLDGPALSIRALLYDGHVAATALMMREGGLDEELANDVWLGHRRVHGHLLAQSLAVHAGFPEAARLRYSRIMRLAVHPAVQQRGLGTRLVTELIRSGADEGEVDAIGTSFGTTPELLDFWHRANFHTVRLGMRREASSGSHAALMLHPLSPQGKTVHQQLHTRFHEQLPALLAEPLHNLEPDIVIRLLQPAMPCPSPLNAQEWRDIVSFAFGNRGYEATMSALARLIITALSDRNIAANIDQPTRDLLILRVLQKQQWQTLATRFALRGKGETIAALRTAIQQLLQHSQPPAILQYLTN